MVLYGFIWFYMVLYGFIWFYMVLYGFIWFYMVLYGFITNQFLPQRSQKVNRLLDILDLGWQT